MHPLELTQLTRKQRVPVAISKLRSTFFAGCKGRKGSKGKCDIRTYLLLENGSHLLESELIPKSMLK